MYNIVEINLIIGIQWLENKNFSYVLIDHITHYIISERQGLISNLIILDWFVD